jgi:hypothetical protein
MAKIDSKKDKAKPAAKAKATGNTNPSGVSIRVDKEKYQAARTSRGTKSLNNGDIVATTLEGLNLGEVQDLADAFIGDNDYRTRYTALNPGMQRMNIGNRMRGAISKATVTDDNGKVTTSGENKFTKAAASIVKSAKARRATESEAKSTKKAA